MHYKQPDHKAVTVCITDFGAEPGTETLQTAAIQAAIDHVHEKGGGTVTVPAGTFATGGLWLRSNLTLHLLENAVLAGSRRAEDYQSLQETVTALDAAVRWNNALLKAVDAQNITILGEPGSRIDGRNGYDPRGENGYRGAHGVNMHRCHNLVLRGLRIADTGNWAQCYFFCTNILAEGLHVTGGHDGFHVRGCDNVQVRDCVFETGDDGIAGFANRNVDIRGCTIRSACNGLRFGGTNVLVENCLFRGPSPYVFRWSLSPEEKNKRRHGQPR